MSAAVLETENLVKVYGRGESRFDALKGLTFEIRQGESVAIVGKSGSGKSTLMHLLALLDEPTAGVVAMNGRPVSQLKPAQVSELRNDTFGFVFQQFFLNANQTVLENVILPLKIAGVGPAERKRRGMEVLEQLDMADKAKNRATDLSGGQKQRLSITTALVHSPKVFFLDEPTTGLHPFDVEKLVVQLDGLVESGNAYVNGRIPALRRLAYHLSGNEHEADCKTSLFSGVYFTEDRIVRYAPRPAAARPTSSSQRRLSIRPFS